MSLTIRYEHDLELAVETYSVGRDTFETKSNEKGFYKLSAHEWLLPNDGITYQFFRNKNK